MTSSWLWLVLLVCFVLGAGGTLSGLRMEQVR